jgi:hypothetical protein
MRKRIKLQALVIVCFLSATILGLDCTRESTSPIAPSGEISQADNTSPMVLAVKRKVYGCVTNWGAPNEGAYVRLFVDYPPGFPDYTYYALTNSSGDYVFDGQFEFAQPHTEYVTVVALGAQLGQEGGQIEPNSPPVTCPPLTRSSPSPGQQGSKFYYDSQYSGWVWQQNFSFECGGPPAGMP